MGVLKGRKEHKAWEEGKKLTRKQAILANCYICNGLEESNEDCLGKESCPLYGFFSYKGKKPL